MKYVTVLLAATFMAAGPSMVRGDFTGLLPGGFGLEGPFTGGSFYFTGSSTLLDVDLTGIRWNSGASMEVPNAIDDFSSDPGLTVAALGWSEDLNDGTTAFGGGPATHPIWWTMNFEGPITDAVNFDYAVWLAGAPDPLFVLNVDWDGAGGFGIGTSTWTPTRGAVVPAPQAVLLGACGLGLVVRLRKRFLRSVTR